MGRAGSEIPELAGIKLVNNQSVYHSAHIHIQHCLYLWMPPVTGTSRSAFGTTHMYLTGLPLRNPNKSFYLPVLEIRCRFL